MQHSPVNGQRKANISSFAFEQQPSGRPGRARLRQAPTPLESGDFPYSDSDGVGARHRHALPGLPEGNSSDNQKGRYNDSHTVNTRYIPYMLLNFLHKEAPVTMLTRFFPKCRGYRFSCLALFICTVYFFFCNYFYPMMSDDYAQSFIWDGAHGGNIAGVLPGHIWQRFGSFSDIFTSLSSMYMTWTGRMESLFIAQLFLYLGKPPVQHLQYPFLLYFPAPDSTDFPGEILPEKRLVHLLDFFGILAGELCVLQHNCLDFRSRQLSLANGFPAFVPSSLCGICTGQFL